MSNPLRFTAHRPDILRRIATAIHEGGKPITALELHFSIGGVPSVKVTRFLASDEQMAVADVIEEITKEDD